MSLRSPRTLTLPLLLSLLTAGCSGEREGESASQPEPPLSDAEQTLVDQAHGAPERLFAGEIRMKGALATTREGVVWLYARKPNTRAPLLIRRYQMNDPGFREEGEDRVLAFTLHSTDSMMPGMPVALPDEVELKIEYDPDGLVETKEGTEAVVVPADPGTLDILVTLQPGMEKPVEAPSQYPTVVGEEPDSGQKDE